MPYVMQVNVAGKGWRTVGASAGREYDYPTEDEAVRMLETVYPDQCRIERLEGRHAPYTNGRTVRVVEKGSVPDNVGRWPKGEA